VKKIYVVPGKLDDEIIMPKKYRNKSQLVIRTHYMTGVFYYKKNSMQYTVIHYFNNNNKFKIPEGYMMINGELYKVEKRFYDGV